MNNFLLPFDLSYYNQLSAFASSAQRNSKHGNNGNWVYYFSAGLSGFNNRIYGVKQHYYNMYALHPNDFTGYEYNLSALLFHMDSAIECFTFALNAIGYGVSPEDFKDITNPKFPEGLKGISPSNIYRDNDKEGYTKYFPSLKSYWQSEEKLLGTIRDQHDVSKHRTSIFTGYDSPLDVILRPDPKEPIGNPQTKNNLHITSIAEGFCEFINISGKKAHDDVTVSIKLP